MYSKSCYKLLSENSCCISIGKWGTEWGKKNRSPIFFWAFWVSFVSWILLAATLACVSTSSSSVKAVPFFEGSITVTVPATQIESSFNFYAGLNRIVVEDCNLGALCPPESQSWDSVSCSQYFTNCDECKDASVGSVSMVILSFITQLPQITGDLGRSMEKYDLHCQKTMGILTGILGLFSTLAALNSFADTCFRSLDSSVGYITLDKHPGAAFILLLIATIFKLFDIWAHVIVPVPETAYWTPDGEAVDSENSKTRSLIDPTQAKSSDFHNEV